MQVLFSKILKYFLRWFLLGLYVLFILFMFDGNYEIFTEIDILVLRRIMFYGWILYIIVYTALFLGYLYLFRKVNEEGFTENGLIFG